MPRKTMMFLGTICDHRQGVKSILLTAAWTTTCFLTAVWSFNVDTSKPIIYKGPVGSYFGYSVAMLENKKGGWILVGAPKAEDSSLANGSIHEPGALFQCNWQYRSSCKPILVDEMGNEKQIIPKNKNISIYNKKDFQWLGASVDVNYAGNENVIVCAPRWKDAEHEVQGHVFMNGICYESNKELEFNSSSPWPVLYYFRKQIHAQGHLVYGMGSVGTSVQYSQDGSFLVLGAPGLNDWTGGYVFISGDLYSRPQIFTPPREMYNNSYIGYAVTTAQFTADAVYIVVGGPRGGNSGKVIGYNQRFDKVLMKDGEQFGSYYGAALCAADLNGDNLDDLLVGAPMYTDHYDEGRVYVYINKEFFNLELLKPVLSGTNAPGARFGTTVTNLKDINNDHFHDIAIGAPYEASTGVVYIYNGAKTGLHKKYSQRIVGSAIDPGLRAFGYAISRSWDIDGNYYADIVVGAYASDKAVLLRTRSVLDLQARFDVSPTKVSYAQPICTFRNQRMPCLEVTICLKYSGINLPPATEVKIILKLDTLERHRGERSRLFMTKPALGKESEEISALVELHLDSWNCGKTLTIFVKESRDVITPLQLELIYDIPDNVPGTTLSCDICPIRNIYGPTKKVQQVSYSKGCGTDDVCSSDLQIRAWPVTGTGENATHLLVVDSSMFEVDIHLSNKGELAYLTHVIISYPHTIRFNRVWLLQGNLTISCVPTKTSNNVTLLECDLLSPVIANEEIMFRVRFYTAAFLFSMKTINMTFEVKTASSEPKDKLGDNLVTLAIPVKIQSQVKLYSVAIPGQVETPPTLQHNTTTELYLMHLYTLHNLGPSPFPHGRLIFSLPHTPFVWLNSVQAKSDSSTINTAFDCEVTTHSDTQKEHKQDVTNSERQSKISPPVAYAASSLSCRSDQCTKVHCYLGLLRKDQMLLVSLNITVRQNIMHLMKIRRQLDIVSYVNFQEPDLASFVLVSADKYANATTFMVFKKHHRSQFAWWVLGVSIISGFLMLYILVVLLWKCGFFRRKCREELQKLLETSSHPEECETLHPPSTSSSEFPSDSPPSLLASLSDENDVMVLPPNNSFYPDSVQQTLLVRNNNHISSSDFNHVSYGARTLGYAARQSQHRGNGSFAGGSLGRQRGHHRHWTPPPPPPPPLPAFNNKLYLEPLEHTV